MTPQELYTLIGGDYDEAIGRMRMDKLVGKLAIKFLDDTSCQDLVRYWREGDAENAFGAAHTAKGVCMNLALPRLGRPADLVTEALRPGNEADRDKVDVDALVDEIEAVYQETVAGIKAYMENPE